MEISSDSEDDCYGNAARRLENLKEKYQCDNIQSTDLINDSIETLSKKRGKTSNKKSKKTSPVCPKSFYVISDEELHEDIELDKLLANNANTRVKRSSKRKSNTSTVRRTSKRVRRGGKNSTVSAEIEAMPVVKGGYMLRTRQSTATTYNDIPTISIGSTMEYLDNSESQTLFSKKEDKDVVIIEDNDLLDENEELFLKIYWQSSEIFKFSIRKYQNLKTIFRHFSEKENVSQSQLLFTYNDTILKPDDTPDSINYNIAKFIDGGIIKRPVNIWVNDDHKNECSGIKLKFQCQNAKKPFETSIKVNDKLALAMLKCAEHLELPLTKLKFEFDGDSVSGSMTPGDLDLEGGECVDVKILT